MGSKQAELECSPSFLPGESSEAINTGRENSEKPGGLLHLRKEGGESMEA